MDIHTQPEAKDSAVSHFQVLMFHHIIKKKNLTHRVKYNKNYAQRKIVPKHRNKNQMGKEQKENKNRWIQTFKFK